MPKILRHDALVEEARGVAVIDIARRRGWQLRRIGADFAGPCPCCGGTDRFVITPRKNSFYCRQCQIGGRDSISLVMQVDRISAQSDAEKFLVACETITGRRRDSEPDPEAAERARVDARRRAEQREAAAERYRLSSIESAREIWRRSRRAGNLVHAYFCRRGIEIDMARLSPAVREIDDLEYIHKIDGKNRTIHVGPAMVCAIQSGDNDRFIGVHRTWLDLRRGDGKLFLEHDGEALKSKKTLGSCRRGAIRLISPAGAARLTLGEGIETTLSVAAYADSPDDMAFWSGISLGNISGRARRDADGRLLRGWPDFSDQECWLAPAWVSQLTFLGDGDSERGATRDAMRRAMRRARHVLGETAEIETVWPGISGDFNDLIIDDEEDESDECN